MLFNRREHIVLKNQGREEEFQNVELDSDIDISKDIDEEEPEEEIIVEEVIKTVAEQSGIVTASKTMYVAKAVNIREDATVDSTRLGTYSFNATVLLGILIIGVFSKLSQGIVC